MKAGSVNPENSDARPLVLLCIDDSLQAKFVAASLARAHHLVLTTDGPRELFDMLAEHNPDAVVVGATNALFDGDSLARLVGENTPYKTGPIFLLDTEGDFRAIEREGADIGPTIPLSELASAVGTPLIPAAA